MEQGSSKAVQAQQATITDASMAKQVDRILSVLETFEQRLSMLESAAANEPRKEPQAAGLRDQRASGSGYMFPGTCFKCGKKGHKSTAVLLKLICRL